MRSLLVLLLFGLLAPAARADDALRARALDLLSAYEDPATAADWQALGTAAGPELLAIARDDTLSHTRRAGAIYALGFFPSPDHQAWLTTLLATENADPTFRRKAAYALCNGWGDAALPAVTPALASSDVQLRAAATRALGRLGTPAALDALRARLPAEPDGMVHDLITARLGER